MPNIWTHILFCEDLIQKMNMNHPFPEHTNYMNLGAQGPDPFFYYNFWPWIRNEPVHKIGTLIHTENCGEFMRDLIISAKHKNNKVRAYMFGFMTHHILDRNTHPYIHYRAGYEGSNHQRLEVLIDTLMMKKYANIDTWKEKVYKKIDVGSVLDEEVVNALHTSIIKCFPEVKQQSTKYIHKAYKDMKLAFIILSDPYGWKNFILHSLISAYSHRPIKNDIDYLNLQMSTWHHSATNEPSTKSFIELYDEALEEGMEIMREVLHYWETDKYSISKLEALLDHISFDTGLPLSLQKTNTYSEPIV